MKQQPATTDFLSSTLDTDALRFLIGATLQRLSQQGQAKLSARANPPGNGEPLMQACAQGR